MVDSALKDKDHMADAAKHVMEMASQQRQVMMEKLSELRLAADKNISEKENIVFQGKVDSMLEEQKAQASRIEKMMEIAAAERETEVSERDKGGKIKKTVSRVKRG